MRSLLLLLAIVPARAAYCHGAPKPTAHVNLHPLQAAPPTFVRAVPNGVLETAGVGDDAISVVHLWGSPRERGLAHGQLMKASVSTFIPAALAFFAKQADDAINGTAPWVPKAVAAWVAKVGIDAALDLTHDATKRHTPAHFEEELAGLAEGAGLALRDVRRVHMIGELTQGHCSMFGAWGDATASGRLLQLRSLDWETDGPFQRFPQVTVYHGDGSSAQGASFANVGWSGWIGAVSGMSEHAVAISEIGVTFPDASFGKESRFGVPFTFLLRELLQFSNSLPAARAAITSADRTCNLILGVGDGKMANGTAASSAASSTSSAAVAVEEPPPHAAGRAADSPAPFNSVQYSHSVARFMNDTTLRPVNATWHAPLRQVVYHGMDWLCPAFSRELHDQLAAHAGKLAAPLVASHVVPLVQTGTLHVAVYDLTPGSLRMLVANAAAPGEAGAPDAYDRPYVSFDMMALFARRPAAVPGELA